MKGQAFSLIELSIVVLIIGVITLVALNGKSLLVKANCVASTLGSKSITDNLNNPSALTKNRGTAYENCINGIVATIDSLTACSGTTCTSCKTLLAANPGIASGTYTIDPDGAGSLSPFDAYCDMTTDSGGWTLVLNYLHKVGTNPALSIKTINLPMPNSSTLGNDESSITASWGHAGNALLNKFDFTELRFYGKTSGHSRIVNFKTSLAGCVSYFKTGSGSCDGLMTNFVALAGHNSFVPAQNDVSYVSNQGNQAMTYFPLHKSSAYHWAANGNGRWEVDDWCNNGCSTYHQIWIR